MVKQRQEYEKIKSNIRNICTKYCTNQDTKKIKYVYCLYIYITKQKVLISKIWMFYFTFAANDLSDSHFQKKFIMGFLIGKEHKKRDTK